jgi:hypothetical protein
VALSVSTGVSLAFAVLATSKRMYRKIISGVQCFNPHPGLVTRIEIAIEIVIVIAIAIAIVIVIVVIEIEIHATETRRNDHAILARISPLAITCLT